MAKKTTAKKECSTGDVKRRTGDKASFEMGKKVSHVKEANEAFLGKDLDKVASLKDKWKNLSAAQKGAIIGGGAGLTNSALGMAFSPNRQAAKDLGAGKTLASFGIAGGAGAGVGAGIGALKDKLKKKKEKSKEEKTAEAIEYILDKFAEDHEDEEEDEKMSPEKLKGDIKSDLLMYKKKMMAKKKGKKREHTDIDAD